MILALGLSVLALAAGGRAGAKPLPSAPRQAPITTRLTFLPYIESQAVAGTTFSAVIGYWSGDHSEITSHIPLGAGACTASIRRPANGRLLGRLGVGELSTDAHVFVHERAGGPAIQAMVWSWQIPVTVTGRSTIDKTLVVRCARMKIRLEPSDEGWSTPRVVSAQLLHPGFVTYFHIYRTAP